MTLSETHFLATAPFAHSALDYEQLRREGLAHLERLAGPAWTDFNDHDPGITILEQLCFALTDLAYRLDYPLPDLLAREGGGVERDFFPPQEVLPCEPVTLDDLRRLVIDVPGVRNAWVETAVQPAPTIYFDEVARGLSIHPPSNSAAAVPVRGLLQVRYEFEAATRPDGTLLSVPEVTSAVTRTLHAHRPLGIDFLPVIPLSPEPIEVVARIEIGPVTDLRALQAEIVRRLADFISPPVRFIPYAQALQQGIPLETILTGPLLRHGFLDPAELDRAQKREVLHTSDLLREIMSVPGVEAVTQLEIAAGGPFAAWTLPLKPNLAPRLDLTNSRLTLLRHGQPVASGRSLTQAGRPAGKTAAGRRPLADLLAPAAGRERRVGRYRSILHQFPDAYGINEVGLPAAATPRRQAQALQLKGYLLFFDQILANLFAQLDHARSLLSVAPPTSNAAASQPVVEAELALHALYRAQGSELSKMVAELTDESRQPGAAGDERRRQLDHLLARFGESLTDYALAMTGILSQAETGLQERLIADRQAFLAATPRLAGRRGTGLDLLAPPENRPPPGLVERLRRKLGLSPAEPCFLVEHILLRPRDGDTLQTAPLIIPANGQDPFSLQLSLVFRQGEGRTHHPEFRTYVERLARQETPAHLLLHVHWLEEATFAEVRLAYEGWLAAQREVRAAALEVTA